MTPDSQRAASELDSAECGVVGAAQLSQFADPPQRMISKLAAGAGDTLLRRLVRVLIAGLHVLRLRDERRRHHRRD
jgi:hypothetical protein